MTDKSLQCAIFSYRFRRWSASLARLESNCKRLIVMSSYRLSVSYLVAFSVAPVVIQRCFFLSFFVGKIFIFNSTKIPASFSYRIVTWFQYNCVCGDGKKEERLATERCWRVEWVTATRHRSLFFLFFPKTLFIGHCHYAGKVGRHIEKLANEKLCKRCGIDCNRWDSLVGRGPWPSIRCFFKS